MAQKGSRKGKGQAGGQSGQGARGAAKGASKGAPRKASLNGAKARAEEEALEARSHTLRNDLTGVVVIVVAVLLFVLAVFPAGAPLSAAIAAALHSSIGLGCYALPIALLIFGLSFFFKRSLRFSGPRLAIGLIILVLAVLGLAATFMPQVAQLPSLLFNGREVAEFGGYLGSGFCWLFMASMGEPAATIILIGLIVVGLIICGLSISGIVQHVLQGVRERRAAADVDAQFSPYAPAAGQVGGQQRIPEELMAESTKVYKGTTRTRALVDAAAPGEFDPMGAQTRVIGAGGEPGVGAGGSGDGAGAEVEGGDTRADRRALRKKRRQPRAGEEAAGAAAGSAATSAATPGAPTAADLPALLGLEAKPFKLPAAKLLAVSHGAAQSKAGKAELQATAKLLQATLEEFGVDGRVVGWVSGPTVTMYELDLGEGVRLTRIRALQDDIQLALAAQAIRIVAPIPHTSLVGIEVPNHERQTVLLGDVLPRERQGVLDLAIGKNVEGKGVVADLTHMPHLLIGGTTGSGKSVAINAFIMSILMHATPAEVRMILIDPKRVELTFYNGIPHLYVPVVTDPAQAASALSWAVLEMERRLKVFEQVGAKNIAAFNTKVGEHLSQLAAQMSAQPSAAATVDSRMRGNDGRGEAGDDGTVAFSSSETTPGATSSSPGLSGGSISERQPDYPDEPGNDVGAKSGEDPEAEAAPILVDGMTVEELEALSEPERQEKLLVKMPYIVVVIDELADLMMVAGKDVEMSISRIAQLARAAGIHLIVATQRPTTNIITGLIKANIVNRIAFTVASGTDSRVILDSTGAEDLVNMGDMLYARPEVSKPERIQGSYVSEGEINRVVDFWRAQGEPEYHNEILAIQPGAGMGGSAYSGGASASDGMGEGDEPLMWQAAEIVVSTGLGSTSTLQRRLKVGYARAGRIMDMLELKGIVGPPNGSKPREVLIDDLLDLESLRAMDEHDG